MGRGRAMRLPEDGAGADERLGEALPIEGAPAVWHDEPPPDDYHVDVVDGDTHDGAPIDAPAPLFADPVTLRPARRTGGIRTPRPFTPAVSVATPPTDESDRDEPFVDAEPRPAPRPAYGSGRPLPRVGTEALGRCVRLARYGAFVDFSGHRGLIHISQLRPGLRVERVEDVIAIGDEVVVRVIAVDPQARHVNLTYVGPAPYSPSVGLRPMAAPEMGEPDRAAQGALGTPAPVAASQMTPTGADVAAVATPGRPTVPDAFDGASVTQRGVSAERPLSTAPDVTIPVPVNPVVPVPVPAAVEVTIPVPARAVDASPVAPRVANEQATPDGPSGERPAPARAVATQPVAARSVPVPPTPPAVPRRREIVGYVPGARVRPEAAPAPAATTGGARPTTARPAAAPKPQEVARTGSRAMRRELDDPNHPMARFLAMSPDLGATARPARPATRAVPTAAPVDPEPEVAPEPPRMVPATRLVHADEPEPELPVSDTPATIEALAARFGTKPGPVGREVRPAPTSRSQAAREAQARMLEQLRRQG